MALGLFVCEGWGLNYLSVGQFQYTPIHKASSPELSIFSPCLFVTTESPYINIILNTVAIHLNISSQISLSLYLY